MFRLCLCARINFRITREWITTKMKSIRCKYGALSVIFLFAVLMFFMLYTGLSRSDLRSAVIHHQHLGLGRDLRSGMVGPQSLLTKQGSELSVVVVEEHHEVIHHWFSAVKQGVIRKKKNILIHIDGHSDGAPPIFYDTYPRDGYFPTTKEHLQTMMQRNDAFILATALSGVIDHFIWIWPTWDAQNHESEYEAYPMLLGEVDTWYPDLKMNLKSCCMCTGDEERNPIECRFMNVTSKAPTDEFKVEPKDCKIHTSLVYQEIREDVAVEMARNGSLFKDAEADDRSHVLLDIDEDFYGCESAIQPALDDGLTMKTVKKINSIVDTLFCPVTTEIEARLDKFLADFINVFMTYKKCLKSNPNLNNHCQEEFASANKTFSDVVGKGNVQKNGICNKKLKSRLFLWRKLVRIFDAMPYEQMEKLKELGFCFRTTPKAYDFGDADEAVFRVCHGANTPNESVVNYHTPKSDKEIDERTRLLDSFLRSSEKYIKPSFITVCRSMRDGYTPRKFFRKIEKDVLNSVQDVFGVSQIHYDVDLMGGKNGWSGRHDGSQNGF